MTLDPVNERTPRPFSYLLVWAVLIAGLILLFILALLFSSPLVSLFNRPVTSGQPLPGITIEQAAPQNGLLVTSVKSDSEAERRGINAGSRIITINNIPVHSPAQVRSLLQKDRHAMIRLNVEAMHKNRIVKLHRLMEPVNGT